MKLPRFTLRELFLLVLVAALALGWAVNRARDVATQRETDFWKSTALDLKKTLEKEGYFVELNERQGVTTVGKLIP